MSGGNHSVTIDGFNLDANTYYSLLQYILKSLQNGVGKDEIKNTLVSSGWSEKVIDFLYDIDNVIDKSNLMSTKEIKKVVKSDSGSLIGKESIEKVESDLKNAIKEFDKFTGRLEANDSALNRFSEKLSVMKDTISETRGMVLTSEKRLGEFETKIEKVNAVIAGYDPQVIEKKFLDVEKQLSVYESKIDKYIMQAQESERVFKEYVDFMDKIKSQEALLATLDNINKKVKTITETEKIIDKRAGKVESIFLEFQDKLEILMKVDNKIESYDEMIKDLIKDIDNTSTKSSTFMTKEDFAKRIADYSDDLESVKSVIYEISKKVGVTSKKLAPSQEKQAAPLENNTAAPAQQAQKEGSSQA